MTTVLPNELLLKLFNYILHGNSYKYLWKIRRTCKKWSVLIPIAINDCVHDRFGNDLKFEIRMEFTNKSIYFHGKFEKFDNVCTFRLKKFNLPSLSKEEENSLRNNNYPGETCCAIHLELSVKQFPSLLPLGWRTKEYIPIILLPNENPCDIRQAKFSMGMILGYRLSPCTNILAEDVFKFLINNNNNNNDNNDNNNNNNNGVRVNGIKEREIYDDNISLDSTTTTSTTTTTPTSSSSSSSINTLHSVAPSTDIELIYLNMPRKVLLELMDQLDYLADTDHVKPRTRGSTLLFTGKFFQIKQYEDVAGNPYQRRRSIMN